MAKALTITTFLANNNNKSSPPKLRVQEVKIILKNDSFEMFVQNFQNKHNLDLKNIGSIFLTSNPFSPSRFIKNP